MRIIVMFDLPTLTKTDRFHASKFRNFLIKDGYYMLQLSVYTRVCNGVDAVEKHRIRLNYNIPPDGSIRLLVVTEKQFQNIDILLGECTKYEKKGKLINSSEQLTFF